MIGHEIGAAIRKRRKQLGWTETQLAQAARTSISTISRIERGKRLPSLALMVRITGALDLTLALKAAPPPT